MKNRYFSIIAVSLLLAMFIVSFPGCTPETPSALPPAEVPKADFEIVSFEVSPTEVVEGKPALVMVKVTNTGKVDGTYSAVLKVNEVERAKKDMLLSVGATESLTFEVTENISGIYTLGVDGQTIKLKVVGGGFLGQSLAQLGNSNGKIVALEPLQVESPYKEQVEVYKMRYLSDGLEVVGFLVKPKVNDVEYPVMIFNRGGNREYGKIDVAMLTYLCGWAAHDYVVVASQYRGNDGGQGKEEFGGSDVNDVLNLIPLVESLPFVAADKIVMWGGSRGGMMAYIALTMTDKVKAAVVMGGITHCIQNYYEREEGMKQVYVELIGGTPEQKEAEYKKRSAYFWPEKINTPILILHGEADWRVKVTQAQKLAEKLKESGKICELVVYPGASHMVDEYAQDRDNRTQEWFLKYIQ